MAVNYINNNGFLTCGAYQAGWICNLGMSLSAGTFSICAADGSALSTTNPGYACLPSTTNGLLTILKLTANKSFTDDAHAVDSDIIGENFGSTTGVAWGNDCPFAVYLVNKDNTDAGFTVSISRNPCCTKLPASTNNIAVKDGGAAASNSQTNHFLFETANTGYASAPCVRLGTIRMQKSASNDWTVQTLTADDGVGRFQEDKQFTMPFNQNGAAAGTYMLPNGGTAATFATNVLTYYLDRTGQCRAYIFATGNTATDGAGAVTTFLSLPFTSPDANQVSGGIASVQTTGAGAILTLTMSAISTNTSNWSFMLDSGGYIQNANFADGNRTIVGCVIYQAF